MSDVERIVAMNWQRRKWEEEMEERDRQMAAQKRAEDQQTRRYELYRTIAMISAMAAGTGMAAMAVLGSAGMHFGALAAMIVTDVLVVLALVLDELREDSK